jgi:hypothetical protein
MGVWMDRTPETATALAHQQRYQPHAGGWAGVGVLVASTLLVY